MPEKFSGIHLILPYDSSLPLLQCLSLVYLQRHYPIIGHDNSACAVWQAIVGYWAKLFLFSASIRSNSSWVINSLANNRFSRYRLIRYSTFGFSNIPILHPQKSIRRNCQKQHFLMPVLSVLFPKEFANPHVADGSMWNNERNLRHIGPNRPA